MTNFKISPDVVVFSHLRWDFVFQRPQHLLTRCAQYRRVYFMEEPQFAEGVQPRMQLSQRNAQLWVAVPQLPCGLALHEIDAHLERFVDDLVRERIG
jgi:UDP-galactopyranose mutase